MNSVKLLLTRAIAYISIRVNVITVVKEMGGGGGGGRRGFSGLVDSGWLYKARPCETGWGEDKGDNESRNPEALVIAT